MGASPTQTETRPVPAALLSTRAAEVRVEEADDGSRVFVEGTMYHAGLNKNAWGLTETGAEKIASDLTGRDYTAAHPDVRGTKYDRSIAEGKGAPIGRVVDTDVVAVEGATLDGGQYTAQYVAEVLDPTFKQRMDAGLHTGDGYGVSIGIYADPESATCSACQNEMASDDCGHSRGEEVEADDGETHIAGPLYDSGDADHLAHVWRPAYEGATAEVSTAECDDGGIAAYSNESAQQVLTASEILGAPYSATDGSDGGDVDDETPEQSANQTRTYDVTVASASTQSRGDRGSYPVTFNND